jgi:hypothetical protein
VPQSTHSGFADVKEFETTNSKVSAKQEEESSPLPPYSLDVAPSDFHRFGHLKDSLQGRRFADDDLLEHYVCVNSSDASAKRFIRSAYSV